MFGFKIITQLSQVAQTSLRSVIGQNDLDQPLSEREKINAHLIDDRLEGVDHPVVHDRVHLSR